ncbi:serine--tRNA ligase [bacterium CG1_02_42_9]|nr:MAG: serine--tRNA ligase [bacterium CG1_02_42_9]
MLDIGYIRQNSQQLKENIKNRNLSESVVNVDKLLEIDRGHSQLVQEIEILRAERNRIADKLKEGKKEALIEKGRQVKEMLKTKEALLVKVKSEYQTLLDWMPNLTHPQMPVGKDSTGNVERKKWGEIPKFNFKHQDHLTLGENLDLVDIKTSAKVSGSRFYYLKNEAVLLQFAIFNHALKKLVHRGFTPLIPPVLLKKRALYGTGYFPSEENQIYKLEAGEKIEDQNELYLSGTSEQAIVSYHADSIFKKGELPKKYVGYSTCFRSEVGSWGKDVRGIKRVHQFDKIEMICFTTPQTSQKYMQEALEIEEELLQDLGLPYRVIEMCTGDVGLATYRKFDVEVFMPSENSYVEVMSNSDLAAFHARRLNIRYEKNGEKDYVHTISATGITNTRPLMAILENYQQEDGSVKIPPLLQDYLEMDLIRPKSQR